MEYKRVRTLLRVSSRQQLHDDDIPIQRAETTKFISNHPDWKFDYEYIERAVSGFKKSVKDRDILLEILEDAKNKRFDILVVFMSDRIGRKEDESPAYVANLNKLGIQVYSVNEGELKTEEHIDKLMNYIRFWQAEGESRKTGLRVKSAQKEMIKQGKFVGGKAPFGYELIFSGELSNHGRALKKLQIVESDAEVVREIFRLSANENYGAFKIAKILNERDIKSRSGGEWKCCTISDMLRNPIYMGYLAYERRNQQGVFQRTTPEKWIYSENQIEEIVIVQKEIWEKVQRNREKRKANISQSKERKGEYPIITTTGQLPLMGIAYCGYCGTRLTNGSRYDTWTKKDGTVVKKVCGRYRCTQRASASIKCEGKTLYKQDEIEPIIFEVVGQYMDNLQKYDIYEDILKMQEEGRRAIQKEIDQLSREANNISLDIQTLEVQIPSAMRGEGTFSVERLSSILQKREQDLQKVNESLLEKEQEYKDTFINNKDLKNFGSLIPNWREEFESSDIHTKKLLLSKIIERIEVKRDNIKIKFKINMEEFNLGISTDSAVQEQRL